MVLFNFRSCNWNITVCTESQCYSLYYQLSYGYIPNPQQLFALDQLFSPVVFLSSGQMVPAWGVEQFWSIDLLTCSHSPCILR